MHTAITTPAAFLTYTTTYVPLIVPALLMVLRGTAAIGWRWWALTDLCFGIATAIILDHPVRFGGALFVALLTVLGAVVAEPIWRLVERPTRGRALTFVTLAGICAPALTGVLDLALRSRTPQARAARVPPRRGRHDPGRAIAGALVLPLNNVLLHGADVVRQPTAALRGLDT